jgi:hypothetical protein
MGSIVDMMNLDAESVVAFNGLNAGTTNILIPEASD